MSEVKRSGFNIKGIFGWLKKRIMPLSGLPIGQELTTYRIMVPGDKEHVIQEVLRKL